MKEYLAIKPTIHCDSIEEKDLVIPSFVVPIFTEQELEKENDEENFELEIGYIHAHRFNLMYDYDSLVCWADRIAGDLFRVAEYFFMNQKNYNEIKIYRYLFYIDRVYIEPQFRGRGFALRALAMFLELFAKEEVVSCHPDPTEDLAKKFSQEQGKMLMRRYWSRLGLTNYNRKHNILWEPDWLLPSWISEKIYG
ncbi:hypothetical protein B7486_47320 [cyanobacterium TDX16]|nr:hypothetical protein B7486_47320 [cyanobacterium TDX16]